MFGVSSYIPLFIQGVLGGSPIDAGIAVAPFSIFWSIAAVVGGRVILRAGYRVSVVAGVISAVAGSAVLLFLSRESGQPPALVGAALVGIGMGLSSTAMLISVQNSVGWSQRGIATSLVQFSRTIGGAIGVAALGTLLTSRMSGQLSGSGLLHGDTNALLDEDERAALSSIELDRLERALSSALHDVYIGMFMLAIAAMAVVILLFPRGSVQDLQSAEGGMGNPRPTPPSPAAEVPAGSDG
jgi:MFS family permease